MSSTYIASHGFRLKTYSCGIFANLFGLFIVADRPSPISLSLPLPLSRFPMEKNSPVPRLFPLGVLVEGCWRTRRTKHLSAIKNALKNACANRSAPHHHHHRERHHHSSPPPPAPVSDPIRSEPLRAEQASDKFSDRWLTITLWAYNPPQGSWNCRYFLSCTLSYSTSLEVQYVHNINRKTPIGSV